MSTWAWCFFGGWIAVTIVVAAVRGARALREGRGRPAIGRLKSPTVYLFAGYLLVAALVTPLSAGESTSPLLWLAAMLPGLYAMSALASAAEEEPRTGVRLLLGLLFGGAVVAGAAIILTLASPAFVPRWLR